MKTHAYLFSLPFLIAPPIAADFLEQTKLVSSAAGVGTRMGISIDTDGDVTAVGAHANSNLATVPGFVTVYRGCSPPVEEAVLVPSTSHVGDEFGRDVAVDGDRILVGAPLSVAGPLLGGGAAFVFRFDGTQWVEEQVLSPPGGDIDGRFGFSVALDGDAAVVGAPFAKGNKGAVYSYFFDGTQWSFGNELENIEAFVPQNLGYSLDLDGDWLVVGAPYHPDQFFGYGKVHTFHRGGNAFGFHGVMGQPDGGVNQGDDYFGASVAMDAGSLVVGAPRDDIAGLDQGTVYAYEFTGGWPGPPWDLVERIDPPLAQPGDELGWTVDLHGLIAVASAYHDDTQGADAGAIHVLKRNYVDDWVADQRLVASDGAAGDTLWSASIHGGTIYAGATKDGDAGSESGGLYRFRDAFATYGWSSPGVGHLPSLSASGSAAAGGTITLAVRDFTGGAYWAYVLNTAPGYQPNYAGLGVAIWSEPGTALLKGVGFLPGTSGVPGEGDLDVDFIVPPGLACVNFFVSTLAVDLTLPLETALAATNGVVLAFE